MNDDDVARRDWGRFIRDVAPLLRPRTTRDIRGQAHPNPTPLIWGWGEGFTVWVPGLDSREDFLNLTLLTLACAFVIGKP